MLVIADLRVGDEKQEKKAGQPLRQPQFGLLLVVQSLSHVRLFSTSWTAALQVSVSLTISLSLPKFMSIESVITSHCACYIGKIIIIPPFALRGVLLWMIYMATPVGEGTNANSNMCGTKPALSSPCVLFKYNRGFPHQSWGTSLGEMQALDSHTSAPQNLERFSR